MKVLLAKLWRIFSLPKNIQLLVMRAIQDEFLVGVTGIVFNGNDEVLLVKHTYRDNTWSLPGGYIKAKEHPEEGLEREIEEESGFVVSIDEEMKIRTDREEARLDICYIGTYIGGEFQSSAEVSDASFFAFENLPLISKNQLLLINQALNLKNKKSKEIKSKPISFLEKISSRFQ